MERYHFHVVLVLLLVIATSSLRVPVTSISHKREVFPSKVWKGLPSISQNRNFLLRIDAKTPVVETPITVIPTSYETDIKRTLGWVAAAVGFAGFIFATRGQDQAIEFCSGYLLEQCLSVDNLIVFLVLFDYFKIQKGNQDKVLSYGIFGSVILRGIFIAAGAVALENFKQVLILFAGILFLSSFKILFSGDDDEEEDMSENAVIKFASKFLKTTDQFDGDSFFTQVDGVRLATPLLLCMICVEFSDILFAFDSVPAIFGVTQDPFVVFTSNIFAISGLRSLFGVLSQAVQDLKYLEKAVGVVLAIIAAKLGGEAMDIELLSPIQSLVVVLATLGVGIGASLLDKGEDVKASAS